MKDKTKSLRISKKNLFVCFNVSTNIVNKMDIVHWENEKQHLQEHKMSVVTQQKNQIGMTAWQAQLQVDNHNCLSHFSIGIVDQISCISTDTTLLKYSVQGSHRSLPNPFIIQLPITPFWFQMEPILIKVAHGAESRKSKVTGVSSQKYTGTRCDNTHNEVHLLVKRQHLFNFQGSVANSAAVIQTSVTL